MKLKSLNSFLRTLPFHFVFQFPFKCNYGLFKEISKDKYTNIISSKYKDGLGYMAKIVCNE